MLMHVVDGVDRLQLHPPYGVLIVCETLQH